MKKFKFRYLTACAALALACGAGCDQPANYQQACVDQNGVTVLEMYCQPGNPSYVPFYHYYYYSGPRYSYGYVPHGGTYTAPESFTDSSGGFHGTARGGFGSSFSGGGVGE